MSNLEEIFKMAREQEVNFIDIRYTDLSDGFWRGASFVNDINNIPFVSRFMDNSNLGISIQKDRCFIDMFLVHKTFVCVLDDARAKLTQSEYHKEYTFNYFLKNPKQNQEIGLITPPFDSNHDLRNEIVSSLLSMGVMVGMHYSFSSHQCICISFTGESKHHADIIQKIKYCILMVCDSYDIKVDLNRGVFVDYKDPYKS